MNGGKLIDMVRSMAILAAAFASALFLAVNAGSVGSPAALVTTSSAPLDSPNGQPSIQTTTTAQTTATVVEIDIARGVFELVNIDRRAMGLAPLRWSTALATSATSWSKSMDESNDLEHQRLESLIDELDIPLSGLGENIAVADADISASELHELWMNSPDHRDNILSPAFDLIGIGTSRSSDGLTYATQEFGTAAD